MVGQIQRIELRNQVAAIRPDLDQSRDRSLFGAGRAARSRVGGRRCRGGYARRFRARGDIRLDLAMRPLTGRRCSETLKVSTPTLLYTRRIAKILLVEGVEKIGVTAVEGCGFKHHGEANSEALV